MGFGLFSTSLLDREAGLRYEVRSGNHTMRIQNGIETTIESEFWKGTIVYMQFCTNKEINPAEVVANRTNIVSQISWNILKRQRIIQLFCAIFESKNTFKSLQMCKYQLVIQYRDSLSQ